jgi:exodeoxyribonuclease-1
MNNEKWYTIPKAYKDSDDLKVKYENENNKEKLEELKNFDLLIDEIQRNFQ